MNAIFVRSTTFKKHPRLRSLGKKSFCLNIAVAMAIAGFCRISMDSKAYAEEAATSQSAAIGISATPPSEGPAIKIDGGYMTPYRFTLPGSEATIEMTPIPGGRFRMGSPSGEAQRRDDEGPQVEIEIEPFWMAKYEVTWGEYKQFMALADLFKAFTSAKMRPLTNDRLADAVTAPSNLYDSTFTYSSGQDPRLPAVTMSQHAAKQYTKWLSKLTGAVYRLPSEAEWEYACRAGSTSAYSFGDESDKLGEYGWFFENSGDKAHKVGEKKPNPWGLYDMHGNVAEWVLDQYASDAYQKLAGKSTQTSEAVVWPNKLYPRVLRGGSWDSDAENCRSAARMQSSDDAWRGTDPNLPKSPWWFTEGQALGVGFRVIRPARMPSAEEQNRFWEADLDSIRFDEKARLDQGRGSKGLVDPGLPAAIQQVRDGK